MNDSLFPAPQSTGAGNHRQPCALAIANGVAFDVAVMVGGFLAWGWLA